MAIRVNHPWLYNYLQLPFYTGDRFKFLPFNMYPGHRGYGAVGGSQGILPQNMLQQFVPLLNSLFGNIKFGAVRTKKSAAVPPDALNIAKLYSRLYAGAPIITPEIQKQIDEYADFLRRVTEGSPAVLPKRLLPSLGSQSIVLPSDLGKLTEKGIESPESQKQLLAFIEKNIKSVPGNVLKDAETIYREILKREIRAPAMPLLLGGARNYKELAQQFHDYILLMDKRYPKMILNAGQDVRDISRFIVKDPLSLKALLSKIVKSPASKYIAPGVAASGLAAWVLGPRVQEALRSNPPLAPVPPVPQEALRSNPPSAPVPPVPAVDVTPVDPAESTKLLGVDVPKNPNILLHPLSYHPMLSGAALGGLLGSIYLTSKHKKKYKSLGERLTSPEMFYGLAAGGLSGAALGAAIHNYAKFMRGE